MEQARIPDYIGYPGLLVYSRVPSLVTTVTKLLALIEFACYYKWTREPPFHFAERHLY